MTEAFLEGDNPHHGVGNITLEEVNNDTYIDYDQYEDTPLLRTLAACDQYGTPVMVILGLVGNTTSFFVFLCTHLRSLSSSVYLAALAVSDNGMLICILVSWGTNFNFPLSHKPGWCQTSIYLSYVFSFLSVWYVVGFTVERYIAVCFPFRRSEMCTTQRAKVVVTAIAVGASVTYTFAIWTTVSEVANGRDWCHPKENFTSLVTILNNIDTVATLIVPSITIVVLNIRIAQQVVTFRGQRKEIMKFRGSDVSSGTSRPVSPGSRHSAGNNTQVTKMLLVVSTIFLLLNFPSHAFRIHGFVMGLADSNWRPSNRIAQFQKLFVLIYYLNFCVNFMLYSLCGQNFRAALKKLFVSSRCGRMRYRLEREPSRHAYSCTTQLEPLHGELSSGLHARASKRKSGGGLFSSRIVRVPSKQSDKSRPDVRPKREVALPPPAWQNGDVVLMKTPEDVKAPVRETPSLGKLARFNHEPIILMH